MVMMKIVIIFILGLCPFVQNAHHEPRPSQNFGQFFPGRPNPPPPIRGRPVPTKPTTMQRIPQSPKTMATMKPPSSPKTKPKINSESRTKLSSKRQRRFCRRAPGPVIRQGRKTYWFSWMAFGKKIAPSPQKSWHEAQETCQKHCMDLVTIDSRKEDRRIKSIITKHKVYGVWTGGQICQEAGCMLDDSKLTWVWGPTKKVMTHDRYVNWSKNGAKGLSQPDDYTKNEGCLAVLNNWYNDGVVWHDLECEDSLPFVCEK